MSFFEVEFNHWTASMLGHSLEGLHSNKSTSAFLFSLKPGNYFISLIWRTAKSWRCKRIKSGHQLQTHTHNTRTLSHARMHPYTHVYNNMRQAFIQFPFTDFNHRAFCPTQGYNRIDFPPPQVTRNETESKTMRLSNMVYFITTKPELDNYLNSSYLSK